MSIFSFLLLLDFFSLSRKTQWHKEYIQRKKEKRKENRMEKNELTFRYCFNCRKETATGVCMCDALATVRQPSSYSNDVGELQRHVIHNYYALFSLRLLRLLLLRHSVSFLKHCLYRKRYTLTYSFLDEMRPLSYSLDFIFHLFLPIFFFFFFFDYGIVFRAKNTFKLFHWVSQNILTIHVQHTEQTDCLDVHSRFPACLYFIFCSSAIATPQISINSDSKNLFNQKKSFKIIDLAGTRTNSMRKQKSVRCCALFVSLLFFSYYFLSRFLSSCFRNVCDVYRSRMRCSHGTNTTQKLLIFNHHHDHYRHPHHQHHHHRRQSLASNSTQSFTIISYHSLFHSQYRFVCQLRVRQLGREQVRTRSNF